MEYYYSVPSSSTTFGNWISTGILESSGGIYESYFMAGWNEDGWFVKNPHMSTTLSDANGTLTIESQMHEVFFEPFGPFDYIGNWVIVGATGDYARLHGQGTVEFKGTFLYPCPPNDYGITGGCIRETKIFSGQGHFDPTK